MITKKQRKSCRELMMQRSRHHRSTCQDAFWSRGMKKGMHIYKDNNKYNVDGSLK